MKHLTLVTTAVLMGALLLGACSPQVVEVEKEVVVTQIVEKEVEVEKIVKEVEVVEVEVEKIVEKIVEVETIVEVEVTSVPPEPVELTFWYSSGSALRNEATEMLVESFMEKYPWITIKPEAFGFSDYRTKVDTATAAGVAPDVLWMNPERVPRYVHLEVFRSLEDLAPQGYIDDYYAPVQRDMTAAGGLYSIPLWNSTEAILYNQDIIEAAGLEPPKTHEEAWSFEEFREALEKVTTVASDGTTEVWGFSTYYPLSAYTQEPWLNSTGARFMDPEGKTYVGYTDSDEMIEHFQWYQDIYLDELAPAERIKDGFHTGKVAFLQANPFVITDVENRFPDINVEVMPIPCDQVCMVQNAGWHIVIHSQTEKPEEGWLLIEHMTNFEGHKFLVEHVGYMPARVSVAEAIPKLDSYPWNIFQVGLEKFPNPRPVNLAYVVFDTEMTTAIRSIIVGADVETELSRAAELAQAELESYE